MAANSAVMIDDLAVLASAGRFPTVLCRLSRARFTGVIYVDRDEGGAVISFRQGNPVFIEDLGGGPSLGDAFLEQEMVSAQDYARVMEHALSELDGSEDAAFAEKAVELGVLTQADVDAELQRRVRGQLIQALAWDTARIDLDDDPDSLSGPEFPQQLGPLLYMAVRTFFDEDRVHEFLGGHRELYVRLLRPRAEVAGVLGLDDLERELLDALEPPASLRSAVERVGADMLEAHQLVAVLVLSEDAEHAGRPWSAPVEAGARSRERRPSTSTMGRYVAHGATEERLGPIARPAPARPVAPAVTRAPARAPLQPPIAKEPTPPTQTRVDRPQRPVPQREPVAPQREPVAPQRERAVPQRERAVPQREPASRAQAQPSSAAAVAPSPRNASGPQPSSPKPERAASAGPRTPSLRPRNAEAKPRRLGAALKRLGRELDQRRAQTQAVEPPTSAPAAQPAGVIATQGAGTQADGAAAADERTAVRELIRRKRAVVSQQTRAAGDSPIAAPAQKPAELMRLGHEALREQQYARAQEMFAKACEAEPANDLFKMYRLWAAFRANAIQDADLTALKTIVRDKLADDVIKPFAYYAMGHLVLAEKKEDAAEKFFKRALDLDKHNRDAERHLRLIELRRKSTATNDANTKIFGIEIGKKS